MNVVKIKGMVASNKITNNIAEWILDMYTIIRRKITGSYTKNKEDIIALKLLKEYTGKSVKEMKYLDIGANHYKRGNNSYLFYEQGARGVLVEADPLLCKKLYRHRSEDKIINAAISSGGGGGVNKVPFYILSLPTRSSMDKKYVQKCIEDGLRIKEIVEISCMNLNELLEKHGFEPDYLSIDIEGMDYRVLRTLNFDKYKIKVIVAENTSELDENGNSMDFYMDNRGYQVYEKCGSNVIYKLKV